MNGRGPNGRPCIIGPVPVHVSSFFVRNGGPFRSVPWWGLRSASGSRANVEIPWCLPTVLEIVVLFADQPRSAYDVACEGMPRAPCRGGDHASWSPASVMGLVQFAFPEIVEGRWAQLRTAAAALDAEYFLRNCRSSFSAPTTSANLIWPSWYSSVRAE